MSVIAAVHRPCLQPKGAKGLSFRFEQTKRVKMGGEHNEGETRGFFTTATTLLGYLLLTIVGKVNDVWDNVTGTSKFTEEM